MDALLFDEEAPKQQPPAPAQPKHQKKQPAPPPAEAASEDVVDDDDEPEDEENTAATADEDGGGGGGGDDDQPKPAAAAAATAAAATKTSKKTGVVPKKPTSTPYLYGAEEEAKHRAYMEKHPEPDAKNHDTEEHLNDTLKHFRETLVQNAPVPEKWTLVRPAYETAVAIEQRRHIITAQLMNGPKRIPAIKEKGKETPAQTTEDYMKHYQGIRWYHFFEYRDTLGLGRWLLSLKHFKHLSSVESRKRMDDNPALELFFELPSTSLEKIGEFTARVYNHQASTLFRQFRGLLPDLLIYQRMKNSLAKQKSTAAQKAAAAAAAATTTATAGSALPGLGNGLASTVAAAEQAARTAVPKETFEMFNQKEAETLKAGIDAASKRQKELTSEIVAALKQLPPAPAAAAAAAAAENGFDVIFRSVYNDGAENAEKRRGYIRKQISTLDTSKVTDETLKTVVDLLNPNGAWKRRIEELGSPVKFVSEFLKSTAGQIVIIPAFGVGEAAGVGFATRFREVFGKTQQGLEAQDGVISGISQRFESFKKHAGDVEASMVERVREAEGAAQRALDEKRTAYKHSEELQKALDSSKKRLSEALEKTKELEKKQKKQKTKEKEKTTSKKDKKKQQKKEESSDEEEEEEEEEDSDDEKSSSSVEDEDEQKPPKKHKQKHAKKEKAATKKSKSSDDEEEEEEEEEEDEDEKSSSDEEQQKAPVKAKEKEKAATTTKKKKATAVAQTNGTSAKKPKKRVKQQSQSQSQDEDAPAPAAKKIKSVVAAAPPPPPPPVPAAAAEVMDEFC